MKMLGKINVMGGNTKADFPRISGCPFTVNIFVAGLLTPCARGKDGDVAGTSRDKNVPG